MNQLVVTVHSPWRWRLLCGGLLTLAALVAWAMYEVGRRDTRDEAQIARQQHQLQELQQLQMELIFERQQMIDEMGALRERNAVLERGSQIDRQAYAEMEGLINELQAELAEYRSDLAFYRGIVSPGDAAEGLRIETFELAPSGTENSFRFRLVLAQVQKRDKPAKGRATFVIEGTRNGETLALAQQQVVSDEAKFFSFGFRYFQNFEGELLLPDDFKPLRVVIRAEPTGAGKVEKIIDWPVEEA